MLSTQVIQAAVPNATEEFCNFILWERTPFPIGKVSARRLYKAASGYIRANKNGVELCEMCDNKVDKPEDYMCVSCRDALKRCRDEG